MTDLMHQQYLRNYLSKKITNYDHQEYLIKNRPLRNPNNKTTELRNLTVKNEILKKHQDNELHELKSKLRKAVIRGDSVPRSTKALPPIEKGSAHALD